MQLQLAHEAQSVALRYSETAIDGRLGLLLGGPLVTKSLVASAGAKPFQIGPLPYGYDGLEPVIDRETVKWQHDVLHRGYVDALNRALRGANVQGRFLEEILAHASSFAPEVQENASAHWNLTFYWSVMTDCKENHEISPDLQHAIEASFTSFESFKTEFVRRGEELSGNGWIWLLKNPQGRLKIATTQDQINPLMDIKGLGEIPILVCDLWEHAYKAKFKSNRGEFLRRFFTLINWARVQTIFKGSGF